MKKSLFLIAIISLVLFACGPVANTETAIDYDKEMMDIQNEVDDVMVTFHGEITSGEADAILDAQEKAEEVVGDAIKSVKDMDDFDGKDDYKNAMLDLLKMYEGILENEFMEIVDYMVYYDDLAEEEWNYLEDLETTALDNYDVAFEEFDAFRSDFADEWDISL